MKKIGILAGTFDPVHNGHINFALEAIKSCGLEHVYLLPERVPRHKKDATHFAHRAAMLKLATEKHKQLSVLELPEAQLTVSRTLPNLRRRFAVDKLYFLMGSDVTGNLGSWPGLKPIIIGLRSNDDKQRVEEQLRELNILSDTTLIPSPNASAASRKMRSNNTEWQIDPTVAAYIEHQKLYSTAKPA